MRYNFQDKKILVVNDSDYSRKMLIGILKVMMVGEVDEAYEATQAYRMANDKKYDTILADISNGASDAIPLAKSINTRADSKHPGTPVVAICGPRALAFMDRAREAGVVDLIQAPYSTDVIAQKLNFIIDLNADQLENHAKPEQGMVLNDYSENDAKISDSEEEEAFSLTHMLLDHYIKHSEIVLAKLKFAQTATQKCITEMRSTYDKVRDKNDTNIAEFNDFDKMWEEVIELFVTQGLSEKEMHNIEEMVTKIPKDIKVHYDDLSQQDKQFMIQLESINHESYKRAKEKVTKLHQQPNPLNGRTIGDYNTQKSQPSYTERQIAEDVYVINPNTKQK